MMLLSFQPLCLDQCFLEPHVFGRALDVAEVGGGANFILSDQPINIEHAYDVIPLAPPTFNCFNDIVLFHIVSLERKS